MLGLGFGLGPSRSEASPLGIPLVRIVGAWVVNTITAHGAGKVIDYATGQSFQQQLEAVLPSLLERISGASGTERQALQEELDLVREQLRVISALLSSQENGLADLRADQELLLRRADELAARVSSLESRVDRLDERANLLDQRVDQLTDRADQFDDRLSQVEEALISECLDRRSAPRLGAGGFRVDDTTASMLVDSVEDPVMAVSTRLYLDSCTGELTQRGLLVQLTLVTRGLNEEISLYATFKDLSFTTAGNPLNSNLRFEFPLGRPDYFYDGQVREFFLPYSEIPFLPLGGRIALALVVTHDGQPRYVLTDRVISCAFGHRTNCRWVR